MARQESSFGKKSGSTIKNVRLTIKKIFVMKKYILTILSLSMLLFYNCAKDNYDEPESELTGKVIYKGEAVGVRQTDGAVQMQLYQDGYELYTSIPVYITQEGTFSAKLFNGTYKLVTRSLNGPWVNDRDTVIVKVNGRTTVEYPVDLYYSLSNVKFDIVGDSLVSTFTVSQESGSQTIDYISLLVNKTKFVDVGTKVGEAKAANNTLGQKRIALKISNSSEKFLFARIALKMKEVDEAVYSIGSEQVK